MRGLRGRKITGCATLEFKISDFSQIAEQMLANQLQGRCRNIIVKTTTVRESLHSWTKTEARPVSLIGVFKEKEGIIVLIDYQPAVAEKFGSFGGRKVIGR
eukprot:scaffold3515_cov126-Cylindrotheca_fusiformis.AAC.16